MEHLNQDTRFNEMILTGLRTKWGVNLEEIIRQFGIEYYESLYKNAEQFIRNGNLYERNNHFLLTRKGMLIADYIISALFSDEQKDTIKLK